MQLVEIRDLDGPNLFMLSPAIKVELKLDDGESETDIAAKLDHNAATLIDAARAFIMTTCRIHGVALPDVAVRAMDDPSHWSIAFSWERRGFALALAQSIIDTINGVVDDNKTTHMRHLLEINSEDDHPAMIRDAERSAIAISVTGTNGKTTTTRLIAHLMRTAGYVTGWNSSSGIYVEGEEIEAGDYSGPSGARRILQDPSVQAAVLETARGGILLRGLGYEHNDVSVFTNVSADHLELQGVKTLETLAEVKAVVCKVTTTDGVAVVNADDPLVMAATAEIVAPRVLVTQNPGNHVVREHLKDGRRALVAGPDRIDVRSGPTNEATFALSEIPMTHNGRARHMVENAMCAIGAALGAGLSIAQVRAGLHTFRNDSASNLGRLNLYRCGEITVVLDYAHNEAGLKHLIAFGRGDLAPDGRLISIIGTAGDRTDHSLMEIGRIAAEASDIVIAKATDRYLRGRTLDNLMALYRAGAQQITRSTYFETESEVAALDLALTKARPGDVIVFMAQEQLPELTSRLKQLSS
jgi:cyanophycin synthetase